MFQAGGEYPWVFGGHYRGMAALKPRCIQVPRNTSPVNYWEASAEKKSASVVASRGPCGAPRLSVALARRVDLKAALLAETRARGLRAALTDRACARRNWHGARTTSSVDGWASMHGAALARGRGGGCEVFRAPPSLGRWIECRLL